MLADPLFFREAASLVRLAAEQRLPVTYPLREVVVAGGLISYGASFKDLLRRAATCVDKILRGASPADLPVEQASKLKLVINLKTEAGPASRSRRRSSCARTRSSAERKRAGPRRQAVTNAA